MLDGSTVDSAIAAGLVNAIDLKYDLEHEFISLKDANENTCKT